MRPLRKNGDREPRFVGHLAAYVEELPGANTQGDTLEEARENVREAVELVIEANRAMARAG